MQAPLIIIKLGGSVISFKDSSVAKARIGVINRLSKEISQILAQGNKLIIIHGAGSFGHPLAAKYQLQNGSLNEDKLFGFSATVAKMIELNSLIMQSLLNHQLPAISLSPHSFTKQINKKIINFDYQLIKEYLEKGFVPVLFGDVVLDDGQGCSILSGDTIMTYLAKKLVAEKIIFLSDVDGIFDSDPKQNSQAKLISEVNNKNFKHVLEGLSSSGRDDVTGEMQGKILNIKENLLKTTVYIANGLKPNTLIKIMEQKQIGTKLHFD